MFGLQKAAAAALLLTSSVSPAAESAFTGIAAPSFNPNAAVMPSAAAEKSFALLGRASRLQQIMQQQGLRETAAPAPVLPLAPVPVATADFRIEPSGESRPVEWASSDRPDIFGSRALPVSRPPLDDQWQRATRNSIGSRQGAWTGLLNEVQSDSRRGQIEAVNAWVNSRIAFADDRQIHGRNDLWSGGAESIRRGRGDCEDYAIAKMQLLRAIGFSDNDLYLTIVKDLVRQSDHAVLVIRQDGEFLVLDNNTNLILKSSQVVDYRPIFTFAAGRSWVHGYRVTTPVQIAALTRNEDVTGTR